MSLVKEFRDFAMRGNVIDLAVGVIIGASFGLLIKSLVDDVLMPPIGYLVGGVDFSSFKYTLVEASDDKAAVTVSYGKFINAVVALMIQAAAIFMVIKLMNSAMKRFRAEEEKAAATPDAKTADVLLLEEIRDLLARKA
jgi:large conductance mechanosensitive channel